MGLHYRIRIAYVLMVLPCSHVFAADSGPALASFNSGISEFQAGHYDQALHAFQNAERLGLRTQQLTYNLGVAYYRLGDFNEARTEFLMLAEVPELSPLAHYNLGLIAGKLGQEQQANAEFLIAEKTAKDPKLAALAEKQLLPRPVEGQNRHELTGFVDVGAGYDDNVTLVSSSANTIGPSQKGSPLYSILAGGALPFTGDFRNGLLGTATLYRVDYFRVNDFTQNDARVGLQYRLKRGGWKGLAGANGEYSTLGRNSLETSAGIKLAAGRQLSESNSATVTYRYDRIKGGSSYDYLTGWRQSIAIEDVLQLSPVTFSGGYRAEVNQRRDLDTGVEFFSESPIRQRLFSDLKWKVAPNTEIHFDGWVQYSRFRKPNLFVIAGEQNAVNRADHLYAAGTELRYRFLSDWSVVGSYQYQKNDSNIPTYRYASNGFLCTLEWSFD